MLAHTQNVGLWIIFCQFFWLIAHTHTQLVSVHMSDMIQDIGFPVDSVAMYKIPLFLVSLVLVQVSLAVFMKKVIYVTLCSQNVKTTDYYNL